MGSLVYKAAGDPGGGAVGNGAPSVCLVPVWNFGIPGEGGGAAVCCRGAQVVKGKDTVTDAVP